MRAGVYGRQSRGSAKSIRDQIRECHRVVVDQGWDERTYSDEVSASWYGTKQRGGWEQLLVDLDAGQLDVLVLWESSRGERRLTEWSRLLDTCKDHGVRLHIVSHERTYDPRLGRDWKTLALDGVDSQAEVDLKSTRVRRGVAAAARDGRPAAGPCPYGYRRTFDPNTGELVGQEPHPDTALVAVDIIERVAAAVPLSEIVRDLNERGVPAPYGGIWRRQRVREIALSATYIGLRKHKGTLHPASWPALVDEATHYAAVRILRDPKRLASGKEARPGRQKHLLTFLAECQCGGPISARDTGYTCRTKGCIVIRRAPVDDLIRDLVVGRLSKPDVYGKLRRAGEAADKEIIEARGEAARLRAELDKWRLSAARGGTSPESLAVIEADLTAQIAEAERREKAAAVPPELRDFLTPGADVRARWDAAPLAARRTLIRTLMAITIVQSARNAYVPTHERIKVKWL